MRTFCRLSVMLVLVSCSLLAKAVIIRTQDPNYTNITSTPYTFRFTTCPTPTDPGGAYLDHAQTISADGCFGGVNEVNDTITSLTLSFPDTTAIQNSGTNQASSDIFQTTSITETNGILSFMFSNGQLVEGQTFVFTEDGVSDLSQFPDVTVTYTTQNSSVTPEPAPALLVATGMLCMGGLYLDRRRRQA